MTLPFRLGKQVLVTLPTENIPGPVMLPAASGGNAVEKRLCFVRQFNRSGVPVVDAKLTAIGVHPDSIPTGLLQVPKNGEFWKRHTAFEIEDGLFAVPIGGKFTGPDGK